MLLKSFYLLGIDEMIEHIKMLLYKTNETIFDSIDFEDDYIYQDPLFFAFFNKPKSIPYNLSQLIYGYTPSKNRLKKLSAVTDIHGRVYIPNLGWFHTKEINKPISIVSQSKNCFTLYNNEEVIEFSFEKPTYVPNTKIEVLKYPVTLLAPFYGNQETPLSVEIERITEQKKEALYNAFNLIEKCIPEYYNLLLLALRKIVIFNTDTTLQNSFATLSAQGVAFFNAYQETYDEVFFIDDIAHQGGHVIFNAVIYQGASFFNIPESTSIVDAFGLQKNVSEVLHGRDIRTYFHALYTYYTSLRCLDACLSQEVFSTKQKHEAIGRIGFYLRKSLLDLSYMISKNRESKEAIIFTKKGLAIYREIKDSIIQLYHKWKEKTDLLTYDAQPYNFTYSVFSQKNPLLN